MVSIWWNGRYMVGICWNGGIVGICWNGGYMHMVGICWNGGVGGCSQ